MGQNNTFMHGYTCFIDFNKKAFVSVDRKVLGKILNYCGLPDKLDKMAIALYEGSESCVPTENGDTPFFNLMSGVKQGYVLSPFMFLLTWTTF
jgi:hypothetical protein